MSEDNKTPMTPEEEDKNAGVERDENGEVKSEATTNIYKLEDGTEYKADDFIKVETREYHQTTHYLNRQIAVEDIINEFGSLPNFEKGLYFDWSTYHNASEEDCWTMNKGGYDVDCEIVDQFTIETK